MLDCFNLERKSIFSAVCLRADVSYFLCCNNHERRRRELLGGSGSMLPRKILNYRVSEIAFSAFGEHQFPAIFLSWSKKINNFDALSNRNRRAEWRAFPLTKLNVPHYSGGPGPPGSVPPHAIALILSSSHYFAFRSKYGRIRLFVIIQKCSFPEVSGERKLRARRAGLR